MIKIERNPGLVKEHADFIEKKICKRIELVLKNGGLKKKGSNKKYHIAINVTNEIKQKLQGLTKTSIKKIITTEPEQLEKTISNYAEYQKKGTDLFKIVYNIFVGGGYEKIHKYEFIKSIGLKTCPYCNRNYIFTLDSNKNLKPQLDHFYPKDKYPILAASYYNLIPACPTCNGFGGKSNSDPLKTKDLINPYQLESDDFEFGLKIKNVNILNSLANMDEKSVEVDFVKSKTGNVTVFGLKELYKEHRDIAIELFVKSKLEYSKAYKDYLKNSYPELKFSEEDINRLITCNYIMNEDLHKRPLSKLTKDIAEQLGLV